MAEGERYRIEVLAVALDVIDYLMTCAGEPQRPTDIARALGINRTRTYRILKTLEEQEFAIVDPESGRWQLSLKCLEIGEQIREQYDVRQVAAPFVASLAQRTGDTVEIVTLDGDSAVIIDGQRGGHRLQVTSGIGQRFPLHVGASPKLLLAFSPKEQQERLLRSMDLTPYTLKTITDKGELRHRLAQIQAEGYAVDEGEYEDDICSVGAPIRDHAGQVIAGITVSMPASRFNRRRRHEMAAMVIDTAERISARYRRPP
jgi:DNA-binding IclR family transcriptional regulator